MNPLQWQEIPGTKLVCPLSCSGPYVISHRPDRFTLSYRPPGQHHHVGVFKTLSGAKRAAALHARDEVPLIEGKTP